jgi:hypothetical protein
VHGAGSAAGAEGAGGGGAGLFMARGAAGGRLCMGLVARLVQRVQEVVVQDCSWRMRR